ncbi:ATP-binding cassette domain-containing protein [Pseudodesulfovibrio cashew]|uniref:ATP-binding cassette domain-containing protein n=1 Tax=Pseudodesulfovibrio cashew TaxID=2678688 RepID=A0A6I6JCW4_9BACT|nr:ABC transporter ATP-binding protein [Pseudodesulfovibrio cashew]QGY38918.1 ATP-binding cassette domain-containing protein [Pseudodesulfovibrio cashew]
MVLRVENVSKAYDGRPVLRDVSFSVSKGSVTSLIGPSGVGKTTLLKIIAGLETPDAGTLSFAEPPSREHPAILVFQDYLLFPNLTVFENVAFGLRARKVARKEIERRVMELLDHFQLADKRREYPATLSAGQRQRVAIARAMVVNPTLLLLDEPFANLDRNLKLHTAEFIRDTQKTFGVTTIAVTHDQEEAFLMSDTVGVMLDGSLAQFAPAREVFLDPAGLEVARFLGPVNILPEGLARRLGVARKDGTWYVRPEHLLLTPRPDGMGVVTEAVFAGHLVRYTVDADGTELTIFSNDTTVRIGERVGLAVNKPEENRP